jgi:hypothetical protein
MTMPEPLPNLYCLSCRYPIDGVSIEQCPECGKEFCREDPLSYLTLRDLKQSRWRKHLRSAIGLLVAIFIYTCLCFPAATQRGYPPIDPFWNGTTYLWVIAVPFFVCFLPRGRASAIILGLYAVATGYINACTISWGSPHRFNILQGLDGAIGFIPMHLVVVFGSMGLSREYFIREKLKAKFSEGWLRSMRTVALILIVMAGIGFPFFYRYETILRLEAVGRQWAERNWSGHEAQVLVHCGTLGVSREENDLWITDYFDESNGLAYGNDMHWGYETAYNQRVRELIQIHGVPEWSQMRHKVNDADLILMMSAKDMKEVTSFPFEVTPEIVLMRRGTITRWGGTMTLGSDGLTILSQHGGCGTSEPKDPVFVGRLDRYPGVVFIRSGQTFVAACTEDGWILKTASKN